jgi:glycosyltransferase involved in cell wall biosynthesis
MAVAVIVPAYQAERSIHAVVLDLLATFVAAGVDFRLLVVDDGSTDATSELARAAGAEVLRHGANRGTGAALRTGLLEAERLGFRVAVSVDADGQHPAQEALRIALHPAPQEHLLLGVRDLRAAGAPRANRFSNGISNYFISAFVGTRLRDTQCGLRRYPVRRTLALGARARGYGFEAEVILRAARAEVAFEQVGVRVIYPSGGQRVTHFHSFRDPVRIILRVLYTVAFAKRRA